MAITYNTFARLYHAATDDIITFVDPTNANSGLMPIHLRKVVFRPAATGDGTMFDTLNKNKTPTLTIARDTYTVTTPAGTDKRITDDDTGGIFNGATIGDWLHLHSSSSGNNLGWWYIKAVDATKHYVDVEGSTRAMTLEANKNYQIKIYTPEVCMVLVSMTSGAGAEVVNETLDWGDKGRWFASLGMRGISGGTVDLYLA